MPDAIHVSPAKNLEDVVLARALAGVPAPRALLVGDPSSRLAGALRGLLDAGWTCSFGRPAPTATDGTTVEQHVVLVADPDAPGTLEDVTAAAPWVVLVDSPVLGTATTPWAPALESAGYTLCQADGLTRYYVATTHAELRDALAYPAGPRDAYVTEEIVRLRSRVDELTAEVLRWRAAALERWARSDQPALDDGRTSALERELDAVRQTLSWRVTAPLRAVRRRSSR